MEFKTFVDKRTLQVDRAELIRLVIARSRPGVDGSNLEERLMALRDAAHDKWHVSHGHDLVQILCLALGSAIGTQNHRPEDMEKKLWLAYERSFFAATQLYRAIDGWEAVNPPFVVLPRSS